MALFIASDLLLFFYLSPLYVLCLDIFLFPVTAAFCSAGISLAIVPSPASFLASSPPNPYWAFILSGSPVPCPAPFVGLLLPAPLPASPPYLFLAPQEPSSGLLQIFQVPLLCVPTGLSHGPCHSQQQADMLSSSLPTVADRLSAKVLGIHGCLRWLMPVLPVSR